MYVTILSRTTLPGNRKDIKKFEVDIVYPHPYGTVQWISAGMRAKITITLKGKLDDYTYEEENFKENVTGLWIRKKGVKGNKNGKR